MNYSCEEEYNELMNGQDGAEYDNHVRDQHHEHLMNLIKKGKYDLHAIEVVLDMISKLPKHTNYIKWLRLKRSNIINQEPKKDFEF